MAQADGLFNPEDHRIELQDNMSESKEAMVFLHEIVHAAFWDAGFEDEEIPHSAITGMTHALFEIIRDNDLDFREDPDEYDEIDYNDEYEENATDGQIQLEFDDDNEA